MHNIELVDQFVELRAQGLSVLKISQQIGVPAATLYHWNERVRPRIHKLKLLMFEQAEERTLGTIETQCESLARCLNSVDKLVASKIEDGRLESFKLPELIRMGGSLRRQLYRLKLHLLDPARSRVPTEPDDHSPIQNDKF